VPPSASLRIWSVQRILVWTAPDGVDRLIRSRTQLANTISGRPDEFGMTATMGIATWFRRTHSRRDPN